MSDTEAHKEPKRKKRTKRDRPERRHKRLRELRCFPEVERKIKADIAPEEVARWIQEDMLECLDVQRSSLVRALYRFKADLPPAEIVKEPPLYIRKAIEKLKRGVNEIEELEHLYLFQLKRISQDAETESKIGKLFSGTKDEIRLAVDILTKMVDLKMELGIVDRSPMNINVSGGLAHAHAHTILKGMEIDENTKMRLGLVLEKMFTHLVEASPEEMKEVVQTANAAEEDEDED